MTKHFFKGSTDFDMMLMYKISQWLVKNIAESTGRKTLQESIPPHRLPVLASFLGCITIILNQIILHSKECERRPKGPISLPSLLKLFIGHFCRHVSRFQQWTIMTAQLGFFLVTVASLLYQFQLSTRSPSRHSGTMYNS